jgi:hypothetical protein
MSVNDAFRIVIDDSRVMLQIVASLSDDSRGIIYDCNMFIVQATGFVLSAKVYPFSGLLFCIVSDEDKKFFFLILTPSSIKT